MSLTKRDIIEYECVQCGYEFFVHEKDSTHCTRCQSNDTQQTGWREQPVSKEVDW